MAYHNAGVVFWKVKVINQPKETVACGIWKRLLCEKDENGQRIERNEKLLKHRGGRPKK